MAFNGAWREFIEDIGDWRRLPYFIRLTIFCSYMRYVDRITLATFFYGNVFGFQRLHNILIECNPQYRNDPNKHHALDQVFLWLDRDGPEGVATRDRYTYYDIMQNRVLTLNGDIPEPRLGRPGPRRRVVTVPGCDVPQ